MQTHITHTQGSCEHGNEPLGFIKGGEFLNRWTNISFSRRALLNGLIYL